MSPETFVGPLIAAAVVIGAGLVAHAVLDAYKQGRMERDIEMLLDQVGRDSESGMRKTVHSAYNISLSAKSDVIKAEDRIERLETWRNGKP